MPLLRMVCEPERTVNIVRLLESGDTASEVAVLPGAVLPHGDDLIQAVVPRSRVDALLTRLHSAASPGTVRVAVQPSEPVLPPPEPSPDDDAVVWAHVTHELHSVGRLSWANAMLIVAAAMIAAIGIVQNQPLLIVGAMALSPDHFLMVDICLALSRRAWSAAGRGAYTLVLAFAAAAVGAWVLTEVLAAIDLVDPAAERRADLLSFIAHPDALSMVVALVAGVAGALAVTLPDARGLVGVLISITTIPAAANVGVAVVARDPGAVSGATLQLLANVVGVVVAGTVTLALRHRGRAPKTPPSKARLATRDTSGPGGATGAGRLP